MRELLAAAAVERPLVIVLEDIHWAEPIFLDLIEHLARTLDGVPVLIVALTRGDLLEVRPGFGGDAPRLLLQALTGDDSKRLVKHLLADDAVAADLAEYIFARAEGNPLFVAELVRMLVEDGQLERSDAGLSAVRSSLLALPPTIHALLAARMDRLEPGERATAEAGAVVGRSFGRRRAARAHRRHQPRGGRRAPRRTRAQAADRGGRRAPRRASRRSASATCSSATSPTRACSRRVAPTSTRGTRTGSSVQPASGPASTTRCSATTWSVPTATGCELGTLDERGRELGARAARRLGSSGGRALARGDTGAAVSLLERAVLLLGADDPARRELTIKLSIALAEDRPAHARRRPPA